MVELPTIYGWLLRIAGFVAIIILACIDGYISENILYWPNL